MYINPLNNGDISDYNSLKKQRDYSSIIKKYQSVKLETKPTELLKYYQYMTYQQPILNELNYVAERMRTEDIKKKTDDYNFIEELKIKREKQMKEITLQKKEIGTEKLIDKKSLKKNDDITPVISSDFEMEYPKEPQPEPILFSNIPENKTLILDLFDYGGNVFDDILSQAFTENKEEKFELSRGKKEKTPEQLAEIEAKKEARKLENEALKEANRQKRKEETKARNEAKKQAIIKERESRYLKYIK